MIVLFDFEESSRELHQHETETTLQGEQANFNWYSHENELVQEFSSKVTLHHKDPWVYIQFVLFFSSVLSAHLVFIFSSGLAVGL